MTEVVQRVMMIPFQKVKSAAVSMQDDLRDQARGRSHQQIVGADLHPMLAASRALQSMTTPVIDDVVLAAVARRQLAAAVQIAIGARTAVRSAPLGMVWTMTGLGCGLVLMHRLVHLRRSTSGLGLVHLRAAALRLVARLGRCQRRESCHRDAGGEGPEAGLDRFIVCHVTPS
jgi:hypothetical protein